MYFFKNYPEIKYKKTNKKNVPNRIDFHNSTSASYSHIFSVSCELCSLTMSSLKKKTTTTAPTEKTNPLLVPQCLNSTL